MNAIVVGVGAFVIAYMCLCLTVSTKDREN